MIYSSEDRFFTSNLLVSWDWTPNRTANQNRADVAHRRKAPATVRLAWLEADNVRSGLTG